MAKSTGNKLSENVINKLNSGAASNGFDGKSVAARSIQGSDKA